MNRRAIVVALALVFAATAAGEPSPSQRSAEVVKSLQVRSHHTVAHVGPTTLLLGDLARAASGGSVHATDSDAQIVSALRREVEKEGWKNVHVVASSAATLALPEKPDLVVCVNTMRELKANREWVRTIRRQLGKKGRVVVIDFYKRPMKIGPPLSERVASHEALRYMQHSGFTLQRRVKVLPYQYIFIFEKKS